jgi:putative transposase
MSRPPRTTSSGTFFLTAITAQRRRLFQVEATAQLFLEILQHYRHEGLYKLHAFVLMPDHVHLLLTTTNLPRAMKHIRGSFSHHLASTRETWQRGYTDHLILTRADFETHRDYIHQNPVRAHLSQLPEDYPYSSAHREPNESNGRSNSANSSPPGTRWTSPESSSIYKPHSTP